MSPNVTCCHAAGYPVDPSRGPRRGEAPSSASGSRTRVPLEFPIERGPPGRPAGPPASAISHSAPAGARLSACPDRAGAVRAGGFWPGHWQSHRASARRSGVVQTGQSPQRRETPARRRPRGISFPPRRVAQHRMHCRSSTPPALRRSRGPLPSPHLPCGDHTARCGEGSHENPGGL